MVVVRAERENSWALAFQLYFPIALYRQRIDLSSAFFDNDSISHLELLMMNTIFKDMPWTVVGVYVLALVGVSYTPFLWHYRWRTAVLFGLAGTIYGGGAAGVEHFAGTEVNSLQYNMLTALEEGIEMLGVIVVIYAVLDFMRTSPEDVVRIAISNQ